jgi:serine/threonine protein kinase
MQDEDVDDLIFRSIDRAASGVMARLRDLEPQPGHHVAHYRIVERLGAGGMGVVFKAEDTRLGRFVALKFLHPLAADDEAGRGQIEREARAASALNHRSICTVHDVNLLHSPAFIVMELLEGETLKDRLARGPVPEAAALDIGLAVASALSAAHQRDLVHCDIKPANIFITTSAEVKVLDFGISRLPGLAAAEGDSDAVAIGSRAFMSPEQAGGEWLDRRTDVYALGMVLRAMVPSPTPRLARAIAKMTETTSGLRSKTMADVTAALADVKRVAANRGRRWMLAAAAIAVVMIAGTWWISSRPSPMTGRDLILIGEFENRTGEAVFDDILYDAVGVKFNQSPYLSVVPAAQIADALAQMRREPAQRLTADIAREICERLGIKAFTAGSIARLGTHYVIRLDVVNAKTGAFMARQQVDAARQDDVLVAIDTAASATRRLLGESLQSLERFDVPLAVATTGSIEALRVFRQGQQLMSQGTGTSLRAAGMFQRAIAIDPDFAMAYAQLGTAYRNVREYGRADDALREAFARRQRSTLRERLEIEGTYYSQVSGEVNKAVDTTLSWSQTYPDDPRPANNLMAYYKDLGQLELAAEHGERAVAILPLALYRANLAGAYLRTGHYDVATNVAEATLRDSPANVTAHRILHTVARLTSNAPLAAREQAWMSTRTQDFAYVSYQANLAGAEGRMHEARRLFTQAIQLTERAGLDDRPVQTQVRLALLEAYAGNTEVSVAIARAVLAVKPAAVIVADAAFVLALAGDGGGALTMTALVKEHPVHQYLTQLWQPLVAGLDAQAAGDSRAAVAAWRLADPYDRGDHAWLRPSYHIGVALLATGDHEEARARFTKVIDYRGVHFNRPMYALAHLGLARVDAAEGHVAAAAAAYDRFFEVWGTADADLPIMKAARAESERLRRPS